MKGINIIIHADDFGLSPGINRGILHTIQTGVVSSTSVIVRSRYLQDTKQCIKKNPHVDWGIHIVLSKSNTDIHTSIEREATLQLRTFHEIFAIHPSHMDFHKGFRFNSHAYFTARMFAIKNGLAFRYDNKHHLETSFYGLKNNSPTTDDITEATLVKILCTLQMGTTELVCHPGWTGNRLRDPYRHQRIIEVRTLTSPKVESVIKNRKIQLINFKTYKTIMYDT